MLGAGLVLLLAALSFGGLYFIKYKPLQKENKEKQNEIISNFDDVKEELENCKNREALGIIKDNQGNKYTIVDDVVLKGNVNNNKYEYILTYKFNAIDENTITKVSEDENIEKIEKEFGFELIKSPDNQTNTGGDSNNTGIKSPNPPESEKDKKGSKKPVAKTEQPDQGKSGGDKTEGSKTDETKTKQSKGEAKKDESLPSIDPNQNQ